MTQQLDDDARPPPPNCGYLAPLSHQSPVYLILVFAIIAWFHALFIATVTFEATIGLIIAPIYAAIQYYLISMMAPVLLRKLKSSLFSL